FARFSFDLAHLGEVRSDSVSHRFERISARRDQAFSRDALERLLEQIQMLIESISGVRQVSDSQSQRTGSVAQQCQHFSISDQARILNQSTEQLSLDSSVVLHRTRSFGKQQATLK